VGNINDDLISVYPNPSNNEWHISFKQFNSIGTYAVTLYNMSGQAVWACSTCSANTLTINNTELPQGMYFLKINHDNGEKVYKIVKQ